jgi:hypothetical protein
VHVDDRKSLKVKSVFLKFLRESQKKLSAKALFPAVIGDRGYPFLSPFSDLIKGLSLPFMVTPIVPPLAMLTIDQIHLELEPLVLRISKRKSRFTLS